MLEILRHCLFSTLINVVVVLYLISKILKVKINLKSPKIYIIYILLVIVCIINFAYVPMYYKFLTSTIYTVFFSLLLFQKEIKDISKITVAVLLEQVIMFISELIFMLIMMIFLGILDIPLSNDMQGLFIINIFICIIAAIFINIRNVNNICQIILLYMEKIKRKNKYIIPSIFIITINILIVVIYLNSNNFIMVIINVIFMLVYGYIIYLLLNEKKLNIKFREENDTLLTHLNEYEKLLDYQRVNNHENKNQLLVIKTMISKRNKKLLDYIDEIIIEKREDNELLYSKTKKIPSGGLQGLIYQKMLYMQECNIDVDLNISKDVRKINLSNLDSKTNFDVCRIIGILLDNAIDETVKQKHKEISISMYLDNEFIIEIANNCNEVPDLSLMDHKGYTTKAQGHGYGLTLLKEICDKNKNIKNERKIFSNIFVQIIKIKM